jgi:hypothetical protein
MYGLRFTDWGNLEQWMRSKIITAAVEAIKVSSDLPQDLRQDLLDSAHDESTKISVGSCFMGKSSVVKEGDKVVITGSGRTAAFLRTFEGMLRTVHLSARDGPGKDGKPLFKLGEIEELIGNDHDLLAELFEAAFELSFPSKDDSGEVKEDSKNLQETSSDLTSQDSSQP